MSEIHDRKKLRLALAVLTEGHRAPLSRALRRAASETHHDSWSWISEPTVQGLGIGWRDHEKRADGLCIKVYVNRKQADSALSFPAPATVSIPGFERAVPIDVQAIGDVKIRARARARVGPGAPIGLEDPREGTGTFGCIVRKRGDRDTLYLLSNCHVIARDGWAPLGTTKVLSPSGEFGGTVENDLVGALAETSKPIFSERRYDNRIDAAIARITDPERVSSMMNDIGPIRGVASSISPLASVRMAGAGSKLAGSANSRGVVRDTDFRLGVPYRDGAGRMRRAGFAEQVLCSDFSEPSDSGAIVLNNRNQVVGLHFASAEIGGVEHSVFNRIDHVLNELDLEIVTDFPGRSRLVPSDDEEPALETTDRRHVPVSPSIPGLQRLTRPHRFRGSVEWHLTPDGLEVDGSIAGTPGQLVTVPMVWNRFREPILQQSNELEIPVELIVATICTESRGDPASVREEPGFVSDVDTPHKVSSGLMHTLLSTARDILPDDDDVSREWLQRAPNSIRAGSMYIEFQSGLTRLDPPLVAAAYNSGELAEDRRAGNRWRTRHHGDHVDRFVLWFNDCFRMFRTSESAPGFSFFRMLR